MQAEIIKKYASKDQWIVASCLPPIQEELFKIQKERNANIIDYLELNHYPELTPQANQNAMYLDAIRSIGNKGKFLILEQQIGSGHTTTNGLDCSARRFWTMEALARGSLSICWFHWRRFRTGCEWWHGSIIERDRRKRSTYNSVKSIVEEIRNIEDILVSSKIDSDIQIYIDFEVY